MMYVLYAPLLLLLQVSGADHLLTVNDLVPGLLVNATLKEVITHNYGLYTDVLFPPDYYQRARIYNIWSV